MNKTIQTSLFVVIAVLGILAFQRGDESVGGPTSVNATASSTVDTLSTTSKQLFATSTRRTAYTVQVTNCAAGQGLMRLNFDKDAAALVNRGFAVLASTTEYFTDDVYLPVTENAVRGILDAGTCTVILTEWRTNF